EASEGPRRRRASVWSVRSTPSAVAPTLLSEELVERRADEDVELGRKVTAGTGEVPQVEKVELPLLGPLGELRSPLLDEPREDVRARSRSLAQREALVLQTPLRLPHARTLFLRRPQRLEQLRALQFELGTRTLAFGGQSPRRGLDLRRARVDSGSLRCKPRL